MTAIPTGSIRRSFSVSFTALATLLLAQQTGANPIADLQSHEGDAGVIVSATGGGHFFIEALALDVKFSFSANQKTDGTARGKSRHTVIFGGQLVEFFADVTCVSVDADNGRAWIGGVVLRNNSEHPAFTGAQHQPGRDIWFRVLDDGEGGAAVDRSTFVGFEGEAGFFTSLEYCAVQPWPDENLRTSPVVQGNIQVRP